MAGSLRASKKQQDMSCTVRGVKALCFSGLLIVICQMDCVRYNR
jgi:hypothetical protein